MGRGDASALALPSALRRRSGQLRVGSNVWRDCSHRRLPARRLENETASLADERLDVDGEHHRRPHAAHHARRPRGDGWRRVADGRSCQHGRRCHHQSLLPLHSGAPWQPRGRAGGRSSAVRAGRGEDVLLQTYAIVTLTFRHHTTSRSEACWRVTCPIRQVPPPGHGDVQGDRRHARSSASLAPAAACPAAASEAVWSARGRVV